MLTKQQYPSPLRNIDDPPARLYIRGTLPSDDHTCLAVIGSRNCSKYGRTVCAQLIRSLAQFPVSIVSGLALGIDTVAHTTALQAGLHTTAIAGSGLSERVLYPKQNRALAQSIVNAGGCLLSEYEPNFTATKWSFPKRNRLIAGLADAVLVVEAAKRSGTLITTRLALEYNKAVLAVPGNISSETSVGTNTLIKDGATVVTSGADIATALGFIPQTYETVHASKEEQRILSLLDHPLPKTTLRDKLGYTKKEFAERIAVLETKGLVSTTLDAVSRTNRDIHLPNT